MNQLPKFQIKIDEIPEVTQPWVSIDLEIFKGEKFRLHRPTGEFACLAIATAPDMVYVITDKELLKPALDTVSDCYQVMQNGMFDITQLRSYGLDIPPRTKYFDTMIMEQILWGGYYKFVGLPHLARRYLEMLLPKDTREEFETATELDKEKIEYCALDAVVTLLVEEEQKKIARKKDQTIWTQVDRPAMWAFLDFKGFAIDVEQWKALAEHNRKYSREFDGILGFNPRSPQQTVKALKKTGFKGIKSSGEKIIRKFMDDYPDTKAYYIAEQVLVAREYSTYSSRYGTSWLKFIEYEWDGTPVITPNWKVSQAETGRTACSDPQLHGVPSKKTNAFRKCFIARPGSKLLIADYSQQEPGITAYLSQDTNLIDIINSGKDVYIETADQAFGIKIIKGDPKRKGMKDVVLGGNYGLTAKGLAASLKVSELEAIEMQDKIAKLFPQVNQWQKEQERKTDYVETVMGRRVWLNPYSYQAENNSKNAPNQGTAADMQKMAIAKIHQNWDDAEIPFIRLVSQTHDEIIADAPIQIAEGVAKFMEKSMVSVAEEMCPGVLFKADATITDSWAGK